MTDEPTQADSASPGSPPGEDASPAAKLPPESRAARSLTDRSKAEEIPTGEPPAQPEHGRGPRVWPRVVGVLILLVGVGGVWVWQNPGFIQTSLRSLFPGSTGRETNAARILALEARVSLLEQRPAPMAVPGEERELTGLSQRLEALEQRLGQPGAPSATQFSGLPGAGQGGPTPSQPPVDLRLLLARLDALEAQSRQAAAQQATGTPVEPGVPNVTASPAAQNPSAQNPSAQNPSAQVRVGADLDPLLARLDALEKNEAGHSVDPARIDALASRVDALAARDPGAEVRGKLDDVEHRLGELTASQTTLAGTSDRTARLARLEAAEIALAAGRPLGEIPGAPPALARFATASPPTEAGLRLAFSAVSEAAVKVSLPDTEGKPFLDRVMARLRDSRLITVREGDDVVIGNPAATTLAHARVLLDAGDLSGAVRTVETLSGPAAEKMAPWLADAKALQAAREALASLTESG